MNFPLIHRPVDVDADDVTIKKNYFVKNKIKNLMKFRWAKKLINKHYQLS